MKPITIIGGGLAGLSTGIALRRQDIPVTIHEATTYPRHRVCGEFICGVDPSVFDSLGISTAIADAKRGTTSEWFHRNKRITRFNLPSHSWQLSRHTLDSRLASLFTQLGGTLVTNSRQPDTPPAEGTIRASGRRADKLSPHIGLKIHAANYPATADLEIHFGPGAYVGVSAIENGKVNICGLFQNPPSTPKMKPVQRLLALLKHARLSHLLRNCHSAELLTDSFCGVSNIQFGEQPVDPNLPAAIGDAGSIIPPFTGNGMSMAFQSAAIATAALTHYSAGHATWHNTCHTIRAMTHATFSRRLKTAALIHPLMLSPKGQPLLSLAARSRLLPFKALFNLTR